MTSAEVQVLVAYLTAADTRAVVGEATLAVWVERLARLDAQIARRAVDVIVETDDRFPSIARFLEVYRAERQKLARVMADERGLPEPDREPPSPKIVKKLMKMGALTEEAAARLLAASGGAVDHAARVAAQTKGREDG